MQLIDLERWDEFDVALTEIRMTVAAKHEDGLIASPLLFRGQSDADWRLFTTLERFDMSCVEIMKYYRLMRRALPQVTAYTSGRGWSLPDFQEYEKWATSYDEASLGDFEAYEFMAYLRHHGYPSPLLDWSRSPYVAAFFAYRALSGPSDRVAIFVYCGDLGRGRSAGNTIPQIIHLGQYVATHRRHFLQQCEYTVCAKFGTHWFFVPHEDVFSKQMESHEIPDQDALWKITLPRSERLKVLRRLDEFNLNAHSLFDTEDTLMETIAERSRGKLPT